MSKKSKPLADLDFSGLLGCMKSGLFTCRLCGHNVFPGAELCFQCKEVAHV
ncbi:hypothetical protein [Mycolicibacterium komossense]|uniref:DUF35 domain-containing protein n=1 Tax=Mycolicibacterium komossense TaxID=1779 RepID=A0ABT3CMS4_9MYCO|nr:hypothetical protein [Mycolicibacterium komossense]MCV7230696.1 hypothetical protein [Mycolicibacterium komossense]